jgi:hypothetical protein
MLSSLRKLIGSISVKEDGDYVRIEGLPTYDYMNDIERTWRTSKIGLNMFTKVTSSYVVFHKFFLPEVIYTLEELVANKKSRYVNYRALRKTIDELYENTWFKQTRVRHENIIDFTQLDKLNVKLFPNQHEFLEVYNEKVPQYNLNGYMLGAAPGTGKTINSIAWSLCLHSDVTVVISPKNAIDRVWAATLESVFKDPVDYWVSSSNEPLRPGKRFYVFHYEQLDRAVEFFKSYPCVKPTVVLDESHNMNEIDSLRTQLFCDLCAKILKSKHVLWMSGTPIKAIGKEVVPLLRTIDPLFNHHVEARFIGIFGKSSSKGLDILANRLGYLVHKVVKTDVVKNVVERENVNIPVPNGKQFTLASVSDEMREFVAERLDYYRANFKKYEAQYDAGIEFHRRTIHDKAQQQRFETYQRYIKMIRQYYDPESMKEESKYCNNYEAKEIIAYLPKGLKEEFRNAKSVVKYYNLKVQGEALGRILGKRRMQCNLALAQNFNFEAEIDSARKKTVIFTSYIEVVDTIHDRAVAAGYKPMRVYGATNKDLAGIISTFEKDPDVNPLIATFQSLSTAVPLIMASTAFMMNSPFRIGELEQTEARLDRVGQDGPIRFLNVFLDTGGDPNLSTRSNDILEWSRQQVSAIMGMPVVEGLTTESVEVLFEPGWSRVSTESFDDIYSVGYEVLSLGIESAVIKAPVEKPIYTKW